MYQIRFHSFVRIYSGFYSIFSTIHQFFPVYTSLRCTSSPSLSIVLMHNTIGLYQEKQNTKCQQVILFKCPVVKNLEDIVLMHNHHYWTVPKKKKTSSSKLMSTGHSLQMPNGDKLKLEGPPPYKVFTIQCFPYMHIPNTQKGNEIP